jgi:hypothetical protein
MNDNGFSPTSRYAGISTAVHRTADGREIVHLTRRTVPRPETLAQVTDHLVHAGDRLDNLAAQYLGDPEQFWQLCDANGAFEPAALVAEPGARLRVTLPRGVPGPSPL